MRSRSPRSSAPAARPSKSDAALAGLVRAFTRFEAEAGVSGVAIGQKETDGRVRDDAGPAVTFFVDRKMPRQGTQSRLADGRALLPSHCRVAGRDYAVDVVEESAPAAGDAPAPAVARKLAAGGPVGNWSELGTFGCLVTRRGTRFVHALTNKHVAIDKGQVVFFPSPQSANAIGAMTSFAVDLVPDERFQPFFDKPRCYFDLDAALAIIPIPALERFSPVIPRIGLPARAFQPDYAAMDAYRASMVGRRVSAWSWNSKLRHGEISHIYWTGRRTPGHPIKIFSFLVRGLDGVAPSLPRDSGKVWVTTGADGEVEIVGLHIGSVAPTPGATRFAVATEFHSLARMTNIKPYRG